MHFYCMFHYICARGHFVSTSGLSHQGRRVFDVRIYSPDINWGNISLYLQINILFTEFKNFWVYSSYRRFLLFKCKTSKKSFIKKLLIYINEVQILQSMPF
ncbi:unnamed protein product [Meganyctiphanes norvegica]|uniref:Uncharacterized protein n=1 Tax=Meganyctiphanes norvegica TaxID=48144 RepID=A0AAV2SUB6_MEGNR